MGMDIGGGGGMKSEPNVVPLCDILLVLLIIFIVVTPMIAKGVDVNLPEAANTLDQAEPTSHITLGLKRDGVVLLQSDGLNEMVTDRSQLKDKLISIFEGRSDKMIFLKADTDMDYSEVLAVLDDVMLAGIEDVGVVTEQATGKE
ncbi:MAG: biopolymer transporter ExbD [Acidobacteriota bacterium]